MQIFEDQHQRHGLRDYFQRFAQFAHHAFPRRAENLPLQRRLLFRPHQRGKLDQPGRCICRQCVDDERAERTAGELTDRFEQRIVRFLAAEALDRLAARHRPLPCARIPGDAESLKRIRQTGLADARFADDEDDLTAAGLGLLEMAPQVGERAPASHQLPNHGPVPGIGPNGRCDCRTNGRSPRQ